MCRSLRTARRRLFVNGYVSKDEVDLWHLKVEFAPSHPVYNSQSRLDNLLCDFIGMVEVVKAWFVLMASRRSTNPPVTLSYVTAVRGCEKRD